MNYIQQLQQENAELKARIDAADDAIRALRVYLASSKFTGNPESELHMYVNVKDVEQRLNIIDTCLFNL